MGFVRQDYQKFPLVPLRLCTGSRLNVFDPSSWYFELDQIRVLRCGTRLKAFFLIMVPIKN